MSDFTGSAQALGPYVQIIEQPAPRSLRFRYECEGRSAGLLGVNSTAKHKTYPTIKVHNIQGKAAVVVSCVTKDPPYRPHPHNLVGKENCKRGICTLKFHNPSMTCSFSNLGVQCVKRRDIEESLNQRQRAKVDPFRTGFAHKSEINSIDLSAIRLCFQVLLESSPEIYNKPLAPVVSDPIFDKKTTSDLAIAKLCPFSAPVHGGQEIILLCDKVSKDDVQVWLFEENSDHQTVWQAQATFSPNDVHKQVAISCVVPSYYDLYITQPVDVWIQLRRPSNHATGEPRPFRYRPLYHGEGIDEEMRRKKRKITPRFINGNVSEESPRTFKRAPRRIKQEQGKATSDICSFTRQEDSSSFLTVPSGNHVERYAPSPYSHSLSPGGSTMYQEPSPSYATPSPANVETTSPSHFEDSINTTESLGLGIDFNDISLSMSGLQINLSEAQSGDKLSPTLFALSKPDFNQPPVSECHRQFEDFLKFTVDLDDNQVI